MEMEFSQTIFTIKDEVYIGCPHLLNIQAQGTGTANLPGELHPVAQCGVAKRVPRREVAEYQPKPEKKKKRKTADMVNNKGRQQWNESYKVVPA
jgi:hypothetical protein